MGRIRGIKDIRLPCGLNLGRTDHRLVSPQAFTIPRPFPVSSSTICLVRVFNVPLASIGFGNFIQQAVPFFAVLSPRFLPLLHDLSNQVLPIFLALPAFYHVASLQPFPELGQQQLLPAVDEFRL